MNPDFIPPRNTHSQIIALEAIQIAAPCHADWNKMRGDDQVRHCQSCAKNVYNLSAMTRDAARRLIVEKEGNLCVQLRRRADGTVITSDCAIGNSSQTSSRNRRAVPRVFAAIAAAIVAVFGIGNSWAAQKCAAPQNSAMATTTGAPMMVLGEMRGEIVAMPPSKVALKKNGKSVRRKSVKMPFKSQPKNHGKRTSGTAKRSSKTKLNR